MASPCWSADNAEATAGKSEGWHIPWQNTHGDISKELLGELLRVLHYVLN